MVEPEKLNYDLPFLCTAIHCGHDNEDDNVALKDLITSKRFALEWFSIDFIGEYCPLYEEAIDWKEFKDKPKCWIGFRGMQSELILGDFKELIKYWEYYLTKVKIVKEYQIPNHYRK